MCPPRRPICPSLAVMIDNHPSALPPAGVERANLVYEAEVEGNYTRLMAVFANSDEIGSIGPVRSARPYFVDWAEELDAVYAHVGGSPDALAEISQDRVRDLNQFYNGQYFWRSDLREAPHNVFTSRDNLNQFLSDEKISSSTYISWQFKDEKNTSEIQVNNPEIDIDFNQPGTGIKWVYDKINNDYVRYLGNVPQITADNNQILAKNIVIQTVPATVIDNELRLKMADVGVGQAVICPMEAAKPLNGKKRARRAALYFIMIISAMKSNLMPAQPG